MDSRDSFFDFRVSMEEMVDAHRLKYRGCLEELLTCYLRANRKSNHGSSSSAIDEQCLSSSTATQLSFTSPFSFSSSTYSSISKPFP
ncbi:hypothetical protein PHJA_002837300 [Phtheirospermum japonicum]|uniref:Transcription repressor n=1 Tax=Phtheirospermum japonicum TaxID=374723 RepID=A0A830D8D7_9LAMI|nr:hypothetical protein PHJA_002837300 [Phtheirospermum japonicum]